MNPDDMISNNYTYYINLQHVKCVETIFKKTVKRAFKRENRENLETNILKC